MNVHPAGDLPRDPYLEVTLILLAGAGLGASALLVGGALLSNAVMLAAGIAMCLAVAVLIGVSKAQKLRVIKAGAHRASATAEEVGTDDSQVPTPGISLEQDHASLPALPALGSALPLVKERFWNRDIDLTLGIVVACSSAIAFLLLHRVQWNAPTPRMTVVVSALSLVAAGLALVAAGFLAKAEPARFPEAAGLARGARLMGWILFLVAISTPLEWAGLETVFRVLYFVVLGLDTAMCFSLFRTRPVPDVVAHIFPVDIGVVSLLGRRLNIAAGLLDAAEGQLGIDLRSTWALTLLRRSLEPLAIGLCLAGWLSTSLTVVRLDEQGLLERFGFAEPGPPLSPGLHLHWPWPVDRVFRIPVGRVQALQIGHEGEEAEGPENVLWAVEHAPNEYTLLLGNGRDLITIDAAVQYRIRDARAWRYSSQNPAAALRAIAYRAVMRSTVDLTLSGALSQNVALLTGKMRNMVQHEADGLGLGVEILGFTVGGMHPPVPVAAAYEAVVSAELGQVTATANAQAYRNGQVPTAQSAVIKDENDARAEGLQAQAAASGQAVSFRALDAQYRAAPEEYRLRRRLETLEKVLPGYPYTVIDSRFLRDGGEIWINR